MEIIIGLLIGAVLGLTGAGGSVFAVPLLILLMDMPATEAMGVALGAVSLSSAIGAYRQRALVKWKPVLLIVTGGMVAAPSGKWVSLFIDETILVFGFSAIAIIIASRMMKQATSNPEMASHVRAARLNDLSDDNVIKTVRTDAQCMAGFVIGGLIVGFLSGLFGVGAGFLIVPLLIFWSSLSMPQAIATSLASIVFISGTGFVSHYIIADFHNVDVLLKVLLAAIVGMLLSQNISRFISGANLQKIFSVLLIFISGLLILNQLG